MKARRAPAAQYTAPAASRFVSDGLWHPPKFEPPRAGSMRASELPSRVADRLYYPRRRGVSVA